jgi:hypothetical protein
VSDAGRAGTGWGAVSYRASCLRRSQRGAMVVTGLLVAVTGVVALALGAGAVRTLTAADRYEAALDLDWDVTVEQFGGEPATDALAGLPAVGEVSTATFVFGGFFPTDRGNPIQTLVFAGSVEAFGSRVVEGVAPDPDERGQFVASPIFVAETGASIGDRFPLSTLSPDTADALGFDAEPDGPTIEATLVGVFDGTSELQDSTAVTAFGPSLIADGDIGISASQHAVALAPGATVEDLRAQLDGLPGGEQFGITPAEIVPGSLREAADTRGNGIGILAILVAVATVVVIGQLVVRQVRPSADQVRILEAIGMSRAQIVVEPVVRAAPAVLVGSAVAGLVAAITSIWFPLGFIAPLELDRGLRVDPLLHVGGALVLAVAVLAWVAVALLVSSRSPHPRPSVVAESVATRMAWPSVGTGVRFAFGRPARGGGSARLALAGMVLVLAGVIAAVIFGSSVGALLDHPSRYGDPPLGAGQGGGDVPQEIRDALAADPDIAELAFGGTVLASVGPEALDVSSLQVVRGDPHVRVLQGRVPDADDEIALGRVSARDLGVGIGDEVVVDGANGSVPLTVTGLVVVPAIEGGDGLGLGGMVTPEALRAIDAEAAFSMVRMTPRDGAPADLADRIEQETGMQVGPSEPPSALVNLDQVRAVPFLVAGAFAALLALSLGHQLVVALMRRRRDVAVLQALGAGRRWVTSTVHTQATALAVAAMVVGLPLGYLVGRWLYRGYMRRIGAPDDVVVPAWWVIATVVAMLAVANGVAAVAAVRARHSEPARLLATE